LSVTGHHRNSNLLRYAPENRCPGVVTGKWLFKIKNYLQDSKIKYGLIHDLKTIKIAMYLKFQHRLWKKL
jgi:hypothetical protein